MRRPVLTYCIIAVLIVFSSCNESTTKCTYVKEWTINQYRIIESQCPDLVLANFYEYSVFVGSKRIGSATAFDDESCRITCQADNENYLAFDVCKKSIRKFTANKSYLDIRSIDSIIMFSRELKLTKSLDNQQIVQFVADWNKSRPRKYADESPDSAFYPAYQYKLTVFSGEDQKVLYGYNYLMIDSSKWQYEMSPKGDLNYCNKFWKN